MVNWELQSKTSPQSPEDGHIYCIALIRIACCHVSENLPLHCLFYVTVNIYFCLLLLLLHMTLSRFCLYLLNIYHFTYTFSHAHTEAHTHKHTYIISTQEAWRWPGIGAWLKGAEEEHLLQTKALHTQTKQNKKRGGGKGREKKTNFHVSRKKGLEHIELPAKLRDYFLRSNKSNINQTETEDEEEANVYMCANIYTYTFACTFTHIRLNVQMHMCMHIYLLFY